VPLCSAMATTAAQGPGAEPTSPSGGGADWLGHGHTVDARGWNLPSGQGSPGHPKTIRRRPRRRRPQSHRLRQAALARAEPRGGNTSGAAAQGGIRSRTPKRLQGHGKFHPPRLGCRCRWPPKALPQPRCAVKVCRPQRSRWRSGNRRLAAAPRTEAAGAFASTASGPAWQAPLATRRAWSQRPSRRP